MSRFSQNKISQYATVLPSGFAVTLILQLRQPHLRFGYLVFPSRDRLDQSLHNRHLIHAGILGHPAVLSILKRRQQQIICRSRHGRPLVRGDRHRLKPLFPCKLQRAHHIPCRSGPGDGKHHIRGRRKADMVHIILRQSIIGTAYPDALKPKAAVQAHRACISDSHQMHHRTVLDQLRTLIENRFVYCSFRLQDPLCNIPEIIRLRIRGIPSP